MEQDIKSENEKLFQVSATKPAKSLVMRFWVSLRSLSCYMCQAYAFCWGMICGWLDALKQKVTSHGLSLAIYEEFHTVPILSFFLSQVAQALYKKMYVLPWLRFSCSYYRFKSLYVEMRGNWTLTKFLGKNRLKNHTGGKRTVNWSIVTNFFLST